MNRTRKEEVFQGRRTPENEPTIHERISRTWTAPKLRHISTLMDTKGKAEEGSESGATTGLS